MANQRRRFQPAFVDPLEARVALHAGHHDPDVQAEVATISTVTRYPVVAGSLAGRYLATGQDNRAADLPLQVGVNAAGNVYGLGRVMMTGTLQFGGFLLSDQPDISGTVTLTNARGSVTVGVTGHGGSGQVPGHRFGLDASIVSGTGAYENLRGIGAAGALFGKNTARSVTTPSPIGGTLRLHLNLKAPLR